MSRIFQLIKKFHFPLIVVALLFYLSLFSSVSQNSESGNQLNSLAFLPNVTKYVNKYYVDKSAINAKAMLVKGMERLETMLDEVLVDFPDGENSETFKVQVLNESKAFNMGDISNLDDLEHTIKEVFQFIQPRLTSDEPKIQDVGYVVTDEMLRTLDPHSGIITPQIYQEFMIETEGSFGGLGIVIGIRDGQLTVISPIEGTPAYNAGIKPNDRIVQIEDQSTINMSLIEAVGKLRGRKGTEVTIYVTREGFPEPKKFRMVRDTINIQSVEAFDLGKGILYVRIRDFQKNTFDSIKEALQNKNGKVKGLILDLRGNPGGLLDQAEKVSDVFLKDGVIVITKIGDSDKEYSASEDVSDYVGEIVVLIDSGSASASEIVAGALKNNDRAVLIGLRSFGKGSVQQIFDLNDGSALKLTIADYLTPGNISIQDVGITPDIMLNPVVISKENVIFNPSDPSSDKPQTNSDEKTKPLEDPIYSIKYLDNSNIVNEEDEEITPEEALSREEKIKKLDEDFYIDVAKEIINSTNSTSRKEILNQLKGEINRISKGQEIKMGDAWKDLGVDWSHSESGSRSPDISVKVFPAFPVAKAGEKLNVTAEVTNRGTSPIYRLEAITKSDNPSFDGKEFIFGKLNPGEKRSWTDTFDIPEWALKSEDEITLHFGDAENKKLNDYKFKARVEELPRPLFSFNYSIIDDGRYDSHGNGNGIPEFGEAIALLVRVKNSGEGVAKKGIVTLKNNSGEKLFLKQGRFEFENLQPGEMRESPLNFEVKKPDAKIDLELQILDEVLKEGLMSKINILESEKEANFLNNSQNIVVLNDKTLIKGGSFTDAPVLAISDKGAGFKTMGENDEWVKIKLNENMVGWIRKDDIIFVDFVSSSSDTQNLKEYFEGPPVISIVDPPLATESDTITINGSAEDGDGVALVYVFLDEDKVMLLPSRENNVPISVNLKLHEGTNVITFLAKDSKGLMAKKSFVVRKEG
ncbi:MAG TPA: MXAN_5808 family serine peptidase [Thermodesulfobacteriota bacterium]